MDATKSVRQPSIPEEVDAEVERACRRSASRLTKTRINGKKNGAGQDRPPDEPRVETYAVMPAFLFAERHAAFLAATGNERRNILNEIVIGNMRLVFYWAHRYLSSGVPLNDLAQEGAIGLTTAIVKFTPSRETQLSTYATWWIRQALQRCVANDHLRRGHRIPIHLLEGLKKIRKARRIFAERTGNRANAYETYLVVKELEEKRRAEVEARGQKVSKLSFPAVVRLFMFQETTATSLDAFVGEDRNSTMHERVRSRAMSASTALETSRLDELCRGLIRRGFSRLSEREAIILRLRLGLGQATGLTLENVGDRFNVSRERIRQIEARAIRRFCRATGLTRKQFAKLIDANEELETLMASL